MFTLQVDGDPISGCQCVTNASSVDYTVTPDVEWSVEGCRSNADINTYLWDGSDVSSSPNFSKTFTSAQDGYAPTLIVGNDDNTRIEVSCPLVKITEGPEYVFDISNGLVMHKLEVKSGGCMSIRGTWNSYYSPYVQVACDMNSNNKEPVSFAMYYGDEIITSYDNEGPGCFFSFLGDRIATLQMGEVYINDICVTFTGAETISCKLM